MAVSDARIREAVEERLRQTSQVDANEVQVHVRDQRVTLKGEVDSAFEKRKARRAAEEVEGVRCVDDRMTIKDFVKVPDDELAEAVRHRLMRDAFVEGGRIEVYASSGEIRLDGEVPDYHARKAAEHVAWWTPGVTGVENLLLVTEEDLVDTSLLEVPSA
jgi:osmotically-inducible protein OsmY